MQQKTSGNCLCDYSIEFYAELQLINTKLVIKN